ncbi:phage major capsid protein [Sinorhizobium meliloti]|uniref:phage major capsid protein n=1 Tax=Rhizobium meliloti TaxID=382 RepID=UPI002073ECEE|nr:phage major capsid protein [Sinorhizobium meliloti]MCM5691436.1 phage major capsid protein [Sinorhizobium meliloti]
MDKLFYETKFATDETGRVSGVAWKFSAPDRVDDVIEPAAFAAAVGKSLPILHNHDTDQVVGVWESVAIEGDDLKVEGKLLVGDVARATEIHKLLQAKAITGLSVGFLAKKSFARKGGGRTITDLDLLEVSLVAVPAHDQARIQSVKAIDGQKDISMENTAIDTKAFEALTARLDAIEAKAQRLEGANDNEPGAEVETKALNQWLRNGQVDADLKTLVVGTPASGGYTVAPEYSANIVKKLVQLSPMRSIASVMSIGTSKVFIPTLATDASGGWVTETGARPSSEPTFGQVEIDVHEHAVVIPVSRALLEDSFIDLSSFLADRIAIKFAQAEATAFVTGDGNGKPSGLLDSENVFTSVTAALDESDLIEKLIEVYYSLPSAYAMNGTWAMNRATMGKIRAAADTTTKGTLWSDSLANGQPARFLGANVVEFPDMANFGAAAVPVVFGDFSNYQVVDRIGLDILRDDLTGADTGVVKFRARRRVGGELLLAEAFRTLTVAAA